MYIIATSLDELESRLENTTRETERYSVTWSISKFFASRNMNIVSDHQVTLELSGKNPPLIGPDPGRIEK